MTRAFMLNRSIAALYGAVNVLANQAGVSQLPTPEPFAEGAEINDTALAMILNNATHLIDISRRLLTPGEAADLLRNLGIPVKEDQP